MTRLLHVIGLITSVKSSGTPIGFATSIHAPPSETLRMVQLIAPPFLNAIVPGFGVRCRESFRFSDIPSDPNNGERLSSSRLDVS